jgi:hypothetical protein
MELSAKAVALKLAIKFGGAATHQSGNSSKRQLIEAATHRTPLGGPFHRKIFM